MSTREGILRTRTIRRVPGNIRWDPKIYEEFIFTPWKVNSTVDEATQVMKDEDPPIPSSTPQVSMEPPATVAGPDAPRRMYIKTEDVVKHGYTPGCPGCSAIRQGKTRSGHNDKCGRRISEAISTTATGRKRIEESTRKENEYFPRILRKEDEKREANKMRTIVTDDGASTAPRGGGVVILKMYPLGLLRRH